MSTTSDMKIIRRLPRPAKSGELVALDLEMFGQQLGSLHRPTGTFACLSIAYTTGQVYVVEGPTSQLPDLLQRIQAGKWCLQNATYDIRQLRRWATIAPRPIHDTMLVERALFGGWYSRFDLQNLSRRWLKEQLPKGVRETFHTSDGVLTPQQRHYAATDAWATVRIAERQLEYVEEYESGEFGWYYNIDAPMIWVVLDMPGVRIDVDGWLKLAEEHQQKADQLEARLGINSKSSQQVVALLKGLGVRRFKMTAKGNESASKEELEKKLAQVQRLGNDKAAEAIGAIIEARSYRDAVSKWGPRFVEEYVEPDGYVYASWRITGAETGRMSCADPPLQQVPIREMPVFRTMFLASKGHRMLVTDVNMQEPRWTAWLSRDEVLQREIIDGVDLHMRAADLFDIKGRGRRRKGKDINLGLNYGMSAKGLAGRVGMPLHEAEAGLRRRRLHYRGMHAWQDRMQRQAERLYHVRTGSGRPVWVNPYDWQWMRNAINAPVQGSSADQTKLAAIKSWKEGCTPCLIVHDENDFDVPPREMKEYRKVAERAWIEAGQELMPEMPVVVDMASGPSWGVKE